MQKIIILDCVSSNVRIKGNIEAEILAKMPLMLTSNKKKSLLISKENGKK